MDIIFIDQNKWIELAKVEAGKDLSSEISSLYENLISAVENGKAIFPLTTSHIIETSKRNDPESRLHLTMTQARLSKGFVFRSRKSRVLVEMCNALRRIFDEEPANLPSNWVIAGFIQAFENLDLLVATDKNLETSLLINEHTNPQSLYLEFMMYSDDKVRREAHIKTQAESEALINSIEQRRLLYANYPQATRKRAYSANVFMEHQNILAEALQITGHTLDDMRAFGDQVIVNFIKDVPTLNIEIEIISKLELRNTKMQTNSLFDMSSFSTAIPYCRYIVAEKDFVSLAKQTKLHEHYNTNISHSLVALIDLYEPKNYS